VIEKLEARLFQSLTGSIAQSLNPLRLFHRNVFAFVTDNLYFAFGFARE